ncbi:unnamed protein product, partial [Mesorhabditis spiculigera]
MWKLINEFEQLLDFNASQTAAPEILPLDHFKLPAEGTPLTLVCHDMANGYLAFERDDGCQLVDDQLQPLVLLNWWQFDIFVYFSHHFVTFPPAGWLNLAHKHGVRVLGTLITEWTDGAKICEKILEDETSVKKTIDALISVMVFYGFDGYLINIENELPREKIGLMCKFLNDLTATVKATKAYAQVIWYDSVTKSGKLRWQDALNDENSCFYDNCDGIYLNYNWSGSEKLWSRLQTMNRARERPGSVYAGVDFFKRGDKPNDIIYRGKDAWRLAEIATRFGFSLAFFAPGWLVEANKCGAIDPRAESIRFWQSLGKCTTPHRAILGPFRTDFATGFHEAGAGARAFCLSQIAVQPNWAVLNPNLLPRFGDVGLVLRRGITYELFRLDFVSRGNQVELDADGDITVYSRLLIQGDPLDAISSNREFSCVVCCGVRAGVKVLAPLLEPDQPPTVWSFKGKNVSPNHVSWSKLHDQLFATASTSGAVVVWDVVSKQESYSYDAHKRSATVVRFHPTDPNLIISGSKDSSIMIYDTREEGTRHKFLSSDGVRDVAFHEALNYASYFVSADDTGNVRFWDMRNPKEVYLHFLAHRDYTSSIAFNTENPSLIATAGGRDMMINIWDWRLMTNRKSDERESRREVFKIETMAGLGRVYWRPGCDYQISSCSLVNDTGVHCWDVRRPYLPLYSFEGHMESCTDMTWRSYDDQNMLVTCGKDGRVFVHTIDDAIKPHQFANDCAVDLAPDGLFAVAVSTNLIGMRTTQVNNWYKKDAARKKKLSARTVEETEEGSPSDAVFDITDKRFQMGHHIFKRTDSQINAVENKHESFCPVSKTFPSQMAVGVPEPYPQNKVRKFYRCANAYRVGGAPISELCDMNAQIAEEVGYSDAAQTWRLVEAMAEQAQVGKRNAAKEDIAKKEVIHVTRNTILTALKGGTYRCVQPIPQSHIKSRLSGWIMEKDKQVAELWRQDCPSRNRVLAPPQMFSVIPYSRSADFYFGQEELVHDLHYNRNYDHLCVARFPDVVPFRSDWRSLKDEAFIRRQRVEFFEKHQTADPLKKIAEVLQYHADLGDYQTCACVCLVVGAILGEVVAERAAGTWLSNYHEMLDSLELFVPSAAIRKFAWVKRINNMSLTGTHLTISCLQCRKRIVEATCQRCDKWLTECVVCDLMIFGMHWMCGKCRHPMHLDEAVEWFDVSSMCPVSGCMCQCKISDVPDTHQGPRGPLFFTNLRKAVRRRKLHVVSYKYKRQVTSALSEAAWSLATHDSARSDVSISIGIEHIKELEKKLEREEEENHPQTDRKHLSLLGRQFAKLSLDSESDQKDEEAETSITSGRQQDPMTKNQKEQLEEFTTYLEREDSEDGQLDGPAEIEDRGLALELDLATPSSESSYGMEDDDDDDDDEDDVLEDEEEDGDDGEGSNDGDAENGSEASENTRSEGEDEDVVRAGGWIFDDETSSEEDGVTDEWALIRQVEEPDYFKLLHEIEAETDESQDEVKPVVAVDKEKEEIVMEEPDYFSHSVYQMAQREWREEYLDKEYSRHVEREEALASARRDN